MAAYHFNTTPGQENVLARIVAKVNAERTAAGLEPFTGHAAFLVDVITTQLRGMAQQITSDDLEQLRKAYAAADDATRARLKNDLGL